MRLIRYEEKNYYRNNNTSFHFNLKIFIKLKALSTRLIVTNLLRLNQSIQNNDQCKSYKLHVNKAKQIKK